MIYNDALKLKLNTIYANTHTRTHTHKHTVYVQTRGQYTGSRCYLISHKCHKDTQGYAAAAQLSWTAVTHCPQGTLKCIPNFPTFYCL